jgi:hypothetical protein
MFKGFPGNNQADQVESPGCKPIQMFIGGLQGKGAAYKGYAFRVLQRIPSPGFTVGLKGYLGTAAHIATT